jgi:hypothetical protein
VSSGSKSFLQEHHFNFTFCDHDLSHRDKAREILQIRLSMLDLESAQIILPPEITKTNKRGLCPSISICTVYKKWALRISQLIIFYLDPLGWDMVTEANLLISSCTHFTHQRDSHKDGRG